MPRKSLLLAVTLALGAAACQQPALAAESVVAAPAAKRVAKEGKGLKTAIFSGGCFWGVEGVFSHVKGVTSAISGYHGGNAATAHYDNVSTGVTGHAESVKVTYDPSVIRYDQLLRIFFSVVADPTQLNRQGPDTGSQYRNALVPLSAEQLAVAKSYIAQLKAAQLWNRPIVTGIERAQAFYPAEAHHQNFMRDNPTYGYIVRWDAPKVAALKKLYPGVYTDRWTAR